MRTSILKDQSGLITVDFIFSLLLVGGFFSVLFALSLTLSVVEITQYITFATARNYHAAHWSINQQTNEGTQKYFDLTRGNKVFSPFFSNGWFEINGGENGGLDDWNNLYNQGGADSSNFIGSRVQLNAKVLEFQIPLFGDSYSEEDVFTANVASYLNREPSSEECLEFMNETRLEAIRSLDASYSAAPLDNYQAFADNGC